MKKGLVLVMTLALLTVMVGAGFAAIFSDTETVPGNTFTAGSIDLTVDGGNDPITAKFFADNMQPGKFYDGGCVELTNAGTLPGKLSVMVANLHSNENTLVEPEISDGDAVGVQVDLDGYNGNTGDGELWDQISIGFCLETGAGSHSRNGHCDWDDTRFKSPGSTNDDYSGTYSIKTNYDFAAAKNIILAPGQTVVFCTELRFVDDATNSWWGASAGMTNNQAMTDDAQLDFIFGLTQVD